ncbi:23S rRNA pseudouridine(2604) synthase RluF [Anaerosporobacter sp.]|uniref:23S rRNA pseudouridine(2604) synthase RluF n=1 Tax=Anaerosporobacter sp. TaxID=1872529 RepID=UPI00286EE142|nr:23S rRNA pseudouridine(2604) synthase RluF [Anaerosporobacter sp.]
MKKKPVIEKDIQEGIRVNKYLSDCGICSRRQADRYVEEGRIQVNGEVAVMGTKIFQGDVVKFDNKTISKEDEMIFLAMNKPRGITCTAQKEDPDNIIDFLNYPKRVYPIGRLDKDSEGLILLTNDGSIVNKILKASTFHEKEYIVTVNKPITLKFLESMREGVPILDTVTRECEVTQINKFTFNIILTQGLNRQIRRMCEYLGYRVVSLQRVRIMNIKIGKLKVGTWRKVTEQELEDLYKLTSTSQKKQTASSNRSKSSK